MTLRKKTRRRCRWVLEAVLSRPTQLEVKVRIPGDVRLKSPSRQTHSTMNVSASSSDWCLGGKIVTQDETGKLVAKPLPKNDEEEKEEAGMSLVTYSNLYQEQNKAQKELDAKQQAQQKQVT